MSTTSAQLDADLAQLHTDAALLHTVIHGDTSTVVETEGGPVRSMSNAIASITAINFKGAWQATTLYVLKDAFSYNGIVYVTVLSHTSTTVAADLAAGKIGLYQGVIAPTTKTYAAPGDFTPGTTAALALPYDPGSKDNIDVYFGASFQGPNQYGLVGANLTFNAPIPLGVTEVFVRIGMLQASVTPTHGSVGDDQLAWGGLLTRVASTLAELKALDTSKYSSVNMLGRSAPGDGAGGFWRFDPMSVAAANDGTIVQPNTGTGRWLRQFNGDTLMACWFGVGMGAPDDSAAIATAVAAAPDGGTLDFEGRQINLIPSTSVPYKDKFNVTRKTAVQITGRKNLALLFRAGSKIVVNGTDAERVGFFLKSCNNITIASPNFPNVSGNTSIAGTGYLDSENYYPFVLEGNDGVYIYKPNFEACRSALMLDAFNGLKNKNIVVDGQRSYQLCNYSIITRNADNVQMINGRFEQTGRSWNTSNEDVAYSDTSTNCGAEDCIAVNPIGTVSRFTAVNNSGPTVFENCKKVGGGIWVEINQASKVQVLGGYSSNSVDTSPHILFTSDIFYNNDNCVVDGAAFYGGGYAITDYYVSGWGAPDIPGLVFANNLCSNCYGPQMAPQRQGVIFIGNRFDLNSSGQMIRPGGKGTLFEGNSVNNGYVRVDGNGFKAVGNHMKGNLATPITNCWDVQGAYGVIEDDNTYGEGSGSGYTNFINANPSGATYGFRKLRVGVGGNPQFQLGTFLTGAVGDEIYNNISTTGQPERYVCVTAGTPGTWQPMGQLGTRTVAGAPSFNAQYLGETILRTDTNQVYYAKTTGTGSGDWIALN